MHYFRKQFALLTALTLLSTGTVCGIPERFFQKTAAVTGSDTVLGFAQKLSSQQSSGETFAELRYSAKSQKLTCDGKERGTEANGFKVIGGELKMEVNQPETGNGTRVQNTAKRYLSLDEAKKQIGCEVEEKDGEIIVRSPFQTARLLVKADNAFDTHGASNVTEGYRDLHVLQYHTAAEAYAAYQALKADSAVKLVEPDRILQAADADSGEQKYIGPIERWGIEALGADAYRDWLRSQKTELPEIRVAVIDTGLYEDHAWMQDRVAENGAGFVYEVEGSYDDDNGHGTHCAGIIISSTLENVKILPVKVLDSNGSGSLLQIYLGMMYALEQNVDAASMSLGAFGESGYLNEAAQMFADAGIPLAVAAGNDMMDSKYATPAMCPSVITVAAVGQDASALSGYSLADFSNHGAGIDFAAPGVKIVSAGTSSPESTVSMDGTSMATPYVAGCIADLLSYDKDLTNDQIYNYLKANARDLGDPGFDAEFGWGMVDLENFRFSDKYVSAPTMALSDDDLKDTHELVQLSRVITMTLKTEDSNAKIYYTVDGSTPTPENGTLYQGEAIRIDRTMTVRAAAVVDGISSAAAAWSFKSDMRTPVLSYEGEEEYNSGIDRTYFVLDGAQNVGMYDMDTKDVTLYYTLDGSEPTPEHGLKTTGDKGIYLDSDTVLNVRWADESGLLSDVSTFHIKVRVPVPEFHTGKDGLTIETAKNVAAVWYTTDGSEPVPGKCEKYTGAILSDKTVRVRAVAVSGENVSSIAEFAYIIDGKDIEGALTVKDGVLVSYHGVMEELDLSKETFTKIGKEAFRGDPFLNLLILPDTCTEIGAYAMADMPNLQTVLDMSVTAIGEGTFMNCPKLVQVDAALTEIPARAFQNSSMPLDARRAKIKTIGEYAFYDNSMIDNMDSEDFAVFWEDVETIGDYAFAYSDPWAITKCEEHSFFFRSLKTAGAHAFENNKCMTELYLADSLTKASDGMCRNMPNVKRFTAMGLTDIGDEALAFEPFSNSQIALNYKGIERIGKQAFRGFRFKEYAEFSSLTALGEDSFAGTDSVGLSFPNVKTVQTGAFATALYADAIYFEHAETIEREAFVFELPDGGFSAGLVRNIVFGDDLKTVSGAGFRKEVYTEPVVYRFAAPLGSPIHTVFTDGYDVTVCTPTIDLVFPEETEQRGSFMGEKTVPQGMRCEIRAIPIGFDISVKWYSTVFDDTDLVLNGTPIIGASGNTLYVDTSVPSRHSYYAVVDNGGTITPVSGQKRVTVVSVRDEGALETGKTHLLDFQDVAAYEDTTSTARYLTCTYTPKESGTCYIKRYYDNGVTVTDPDGHTVTGVYDSETSSELYTLKAGVQYQICVPQTTQNRYDCITVIPIKKYDLTKSMELSAVTCEEGLVYTGEPLTPHPKIDQGAEYQWDPETEDYIYIKGNVLTEGQDYELHYEYHYNDGYGLVYAVGINGYFGMAVGSFSFETASTAYRKLPGLYLNKPVALHDYGKDPVEFVLSPSVSTDYTLKMYLTDEQLTEYYEKRMQFNCQTVRMTVYEMDSKGNRTEIFSNCDGYGGMGMPMLLSIPLEKGHWYVVSLTPDESSSAPVLFGTLELYKAPEIKRSIKDIEWKVEDAFYTGEAVMPEETMYDALFRETLTEGVDYKLFAFNNVEPGYAQIVAVGLGKYEGMIDSGFSIGFDCDNTRGDVQTIAADAPFTVQKGTHGYRFDIKEDCYATMDVPEGAEFRGVLMQTWELYGSSGWCTYYTFEHDTFNVKMTDENGEVHNGLALSAGEYYIAFMDCADEYELKINTLDAVPDIANAEITCKDCDYTGEAVKPVLQVTYDGVLLTEGTDYEVQYPADMVNCGIHTLTVSGIGRFVGSVQVEMNILPVKMLANGQTLEEGSNTAKITKEQSTVYYVWTPQQENWTLWSNELLGKRVLIYEEDGAGRFHVMSGLEGCGYQYTNVEVTPKKTYLVTASFMSDETEKDLVFHATPNGTLLDGCTVDAAERIVVKEGTETFSEIPEYRILDGETVLEKGVDYEELYHEGDHAYGRAIIAFRGIGRYTGELYYSYMIAPEKPEGIQSSETIPEDTALTQDEPFYSHLEFPSCGFMAHFTADAAGTYYLLLPDPDIDSATAFVYDSKGTLLPQDTKMVTLKKGERIVIAAVSNTAESSMNMMQSFSIGVMTTPAAHSMELDDMTIYVVNGAFTVVDWADMKDVNAISLPDSVYDELYGKQIPIAGMNEELYAALGCPVIYVEPNSEADAAVGHNGTFICQYLHSDSKIKGDVSGDELIDWRDADILSRYLAELDGVRLPDFAYANADMNGDGSVDIFDVTAILGYYDENGAG